MGLKVTTIARMPVDGSRDYFVYFLDYGWDNELSEAMYRNFDRFAGGIAGHRAVVVAGLNRSEFANEVLSWHHVNGEDAKEYLPAIMIADCHPAELAGLEDFDAPGDKGVRVFRRRGTQHISGQLKRMVLIPLRENCKSESDVCQLLQSIESDIRAGTSLRKFSVLKTIERADRGLADALILQPNFAGIGIDLKSVFTQGKRYWHKLMGGGPD